MSSQSGESLEEQVKLLIEWRKIMNPLTIFVNQNFTAGHSGSDAFGEVLK